MMTIEKKGKQKKKKRHEKKIIGKAERNTKGQINQKETK